MRDRYGLYAEIGDVVENVHFTLRDDWRNRRQCAYSLFLFRVGPGQLLKIAKNELEKGGFWVLERHFGTQNHPSKAIEMPGADRHYLPGDAWHIGHCGERIL